MCVFAKLLLLELTCLVLSQTDVDTNSADIQNEIVTEHNNYRRISGSSNMQKMEWNQDAASLAQQHAGNCVFEHESNDDRKTSQFPCGQNIYKSGDPKTWKDAIKVWYDEIANFTYGVPTGKMNGHYTQETRRVIMDNADVWRHFNMNYIIKENNNNSRRSGMAFVISKSIAYGISEVMNVVWAKSFQVGCGYSLCNSDESFHFFVCDYCPAGNIQGQEILPFKQGNACDSCPGKCDACPDNKCGACPDNCDDGLCIKHCSYVDGLSNCNELVKDGDDCSESNQFTAQCQASCHSDECKES